MSNEVRVTHTFEASPERVFDAWIDPDKVRRWFGAPAASMGMAPDEIVRVAVDARVGGTFSFVVRRQGEEIDHTGEYLELDRPRRLVFTWRVPKYSNDVTKVSIDFVAKGSGTEVTLVHEPVAEEYRARTEKGWGAILGAIASARAA